MITAQSTTAEVIAHHRQAVADFEDALAAETDPGERFYLEKRIAGHRERLARAEAIAQRHREHAVQHRAWAKEGA